MGGRAMSGRRGRDAALAESAHGVRDISAASRARWRRGDGLDLAGARLSGARLRGAHLRRADLTRADLSDADLSRADARGSQWICVVTERLNLTGADLRGANLTGANFAGRLGCWHRIILRW